MEGRCFWRIYWGRGRNEGKNWSIWNSAKSLFETSGLDSSSLFNIPRNHSFFRFLKLHFSCFECSPNPTFVRIEGRALMSENEANRCDNVNGLCVICCLSARLSRRVKLLKCFLQWRAVWLVGWNAKREVAKPYLGTYNHSMQNKLWVGSQEPSWSWI